MSDGCKFLISCHNLKYFSAILFIFKLFHTYYVNLFQFSVAFVNKLFGFELILFKKMLYQFNPMPSDIFY